MQRHPVAKCKRVYVGYSLPLRTGQNATNLAKGTGRLEVAFKFKGTGDCVSGLGLAVRGSSPTETIRTHEGALSARREYFATMLGSGFAEGTGGTTSGGATVRARLPVADTTPDAFRALLQFAAHGHRRP